MTNLPEEVIVKDGLLWKADWLVKQADGDRLKMEDARVQIAKSISLIQSDGLRGDYIKEVCPLLKMNRRALEKLVAGDMGKAENKFVDDEDRLFKLPASVDIKFFGEWGFYELNDGPMKTGYHFDQGRDKRQFECTNFILRPLFHLQNTKKELNKRFFEVHNGFTNHTIEIQSGKIMSVDAIQTELSNAGNYLFYGTRMHLGRLNAWWGQKFPTGYELLNLGWQAEGFFAYSDHIFNGALQKYDDYGITVHKESHFYSPGANKKLGLQRADDLAKKFDADYQLRYMELPKTIHGLPLTFEYWMEVIMRVFPEHAITAVGVVLMCSLRDLFLHFSSNFPILYAYGERQSGKSEFVLSMMQVFINDAKLFNLNSGTDAAFYTFVGRFVNCFTGLNEFDDKDVRPEWFQAIKGFYDIEGRKRNIDKYKMEEQAINSMVGLAGQYLSTRDDNSVPSRALLCQFHSKPNRTQEEMSNFQELVDLNKQGINGLLCEVLAPRLSTGMNARKLKDIFESTLKDLRSIFKERDLRWEDRPGRNYAMMLSSIIWGSEHFKLPFSVEEAREYAVVQIMQINTIMHTTDVLMEFWRTLSNLTDNGILQQGWHFKIEDGVTKLKLKKGDVVIDRDFMEPRRLLFIRLEHCHQEYQKEMGRTRGTSMNATSLKNYFTNREYFLGTVDGKWFYRTHNGQKQTTNTSTYVMDYDELAKMGINLDLGNSTPDPEPEEKNTVEELPF